MERRILCLLGLAVCAIVLTTCMASKDKGDAEWEAFKTKKGKKYKDDKEEGERKEIFMTNLEKVEKQNKDHDEGKSGWRAALNDFADMSKEEFLAKKTGFKRPTVEEMKGVKVLPPVDNVKRLVPPEFPDTEIQIPDSLDYRTPDFNLVTRVRDQGDCGSCYAFSAVGALEALHMKTFGTLLELSEQWIVDCSGSPDGCDGGLMKDAFVDVKNNEGGIPTLSDYPYTGQDDSTCKNKTDVWVGIADYAAYEPGLGPSEVDIQEWLVFFGMPQTVSLCVNDEYQNYASGVFSSSTCNCQANHAMLVVGWGVEPAYWWWQDDKKYWILKNSWGIGWGEDGYMKIERDKQMCNFGDCFAMVW